MTKRNSDILVGTALVGVSVLWCSYVLATIPPGTGGGDVGPRAFPLLLGFLLGLMSAGFVLHRIILGRSARLSDGEYERPAPEPLADATAQRADAQDVKRNRRAEFLFLVLTPTMIAGYGFAMQTIGFVLATLLIVVLTMLLCLGERSPFRIAAMSVGVTFGCWLVFGIILDIPLATGSWINLG